MPVRTARESGSTTRSSAKLDELADFLYSRETITGEEFMEILNREAAQAQ